METKNNLKDNVTAKMQDLEEHLFYELSGRWPWMLGLHDAGTFADNAFFTVIFLFEMCA